MNNRNLSPARRPGNHGLQPESQDQAQPGFQDVLTFIRQSRFRALQAVNTELAHLYWRIGEHLSHRVRAEAWGQKTIEALAAWIRIQEPASRGFSVQNLWRMRQFFETYQGDEFLSLLVRESSWSHNMIIINKYNSRKERAFYLKLAVRERWGRRELERQLDGGLFERAVLDKPKLSAAMKEVHPLAEGIFKDRYLMDFVGLPEDHSERDLQKALLHHLKAFLLELGRDFCFIGSEFPVQVGNRDFVIDLLFFHRGLQALVAIELKIGEFEPEHLGKLAFYLEALDRYHRKPHEAPMRGENPALGQKMNSVKQGVPGEDLMANA